MDPILFLWAFAYYEESYNFMDVPNLYVLDCFDVK